MDRGIFYRISLFLLLSFIIPQVLPAVEGLTLVTLPVENLNADYTQKIVKQLEANLKGKKRTVHVIPPAPRMVSEAPQTSNLSQALQKAQDEQFNFQDRRAIQILESSLAAFESNRADPDSIMKLADAHLFIAFCHKNLGETEAMNRAMDEAARLNPNLVPNEMLFPPSLAQIFERAKDRIWNQGHFARLRIETSPEGAHVYVNGSYKGKTPLRLDRYPVGEHHLLVTLEGKRAYKKVVLKENDSPTVRLKPSASMKAPLPPKRGRDDLPPSNFKKQKEWLRSQSPSGALLGIGIVAKGKKTILVFHPLGLENANPQIIEITGGATAKEVAAQLSEMIP